MTNPHGGRNSGSSDTEVEWWDVQSLVRRPYRDWCASAHLILEIHDAELARKWLYETVLPLVRVACDVHNLHDPKGEKPKLAFETLHASIAFTAPGLRKLGVSATDLETFDAAFVEGMAPTPDGNDTSPGSPIRAKGSTRRAGILGDLHENHASNWHWGGIDILPDGSEHPNKLGRATQDRIDLLLMIFAKKTNRAAITAFINQINRIAHGVDDPVAAALAHRGLRPWHQVTTLSEREHFGFLDGLSQPIFPDSERKHGGVGDRWRRFHEVRSGEFVLGYRNERDEFPESPSLAPEDFPGCRLPTRGNADGVSDPDRLDFGRNGTYLVARQLHQNLGTFDRLVHRAADLIKSDHEAPRLEKAAGLLMGRGLDGEPLVPDHGKPDDKTKEWPVFNDYGFHQSDPAGLLCPIGSHVRRANPRDSLEPGPDAALSMSKQHRILRRSRLYGPRSERLGFWDADGDMRRMPDPDLSEDQLERLRDEEDGIERGLFFICLNADIAGQFEFIQDTWLNNPNFGDLEGERDAILAASLDTKVSLPSVPFTRRMDRTEMVNGVRTGKPVVEVRGGAYFFLPGYRALRALVEATKPLLITATPSDAEDQSNA
ncbi:MAG: hypothetical protein AAF479_02555 [Pseudomonadota bacterium]